LTPSLDTQTLKNVRLASWEFLAATWSGRTELEDHHGTLLASRFPLLVKLSVHSHAIASHVAELTHLTHLHLSFRTLPVSGKWYSDARVLDTYDLVRLTGLRHLALEHCFVLDLAPFSGMPHLRHLDLGKCSVPPEAPAAIARMTGLRHLSLTNVNTDLAFVSPLVHLTQLRLTHFWIRHSDNLAHMSLLCNLRELDMSRTIVEPWGFGAAALVHLPTQLTRLDLSGCSMKFPYSEYTEFLASRGFTA
jgi:hypothetical protein